MLCITKNWEKDQEWWMSWNYWNISGCSEDDFDWKQDYRKIMLLQRSIISRLSDLWPSLFSDSSAECWTIPKTRNHVQILVCRILHSAWYSTLLAFNVKMFPFVCVLSITKWRESISCNSFITATRVHVAFAFI